MAHSPAFNRRWSAALFDLDGTLVDTRPGILAALTRALDDLGQSHVGVGSVDLSLPLNDMVRTAAAGPAEAEVSRLIARFRYHYDSNDWRLGSPYPGAAACLSALRDAGVRVYVVTNKRGVVANRILEHHRLATLVLGVYGQSEANEAVAKAVLALRCLKDHDLAAPTTVVVGDSDHDMVMAADMEMDALAVTYGIGPLTRSRRQSRRIEIDSLTEVATVILAGSTEEGDT